MVKQFTKRVGLLIFASLLGLSPTVSAMAQPNLSGIDPEIPGRITIHRLAGSTAQEPSVGTPLVGIPYTIELVRLRSDVEQTAQNLVNPDNFEPITGAAAFEMQVSTDANGVANFTDLPHGIYLVTEGAHSVTPASDRIEPFIVGIPRRSSDGTSWLYEVDVYPKSEEDTALDLRKEGTLYWDETQADLVAEWTVETTLPRLIGNATQLRFVDELDARLTFVPGSVVGTYWRLENVADVPTQTEATLIYNTHYLVDFDESTRLLIIELTAEGRAALAQNAILAPTGTLAFTFRTTVAIPSRENASQLGEISNEVTLYYNEENGIQATATVTQLALEVEKVDVNGDLIGNGDPINEATFELFLSEDENDPAFSNAAGDNRQFSASNGVAFIPGLMTGTYYLREVASPQGYRQIQDFMPVNVTVGTEDRPYVTLVQVVNEVDEGFVLPETGGMGTLLFTAAGLLLIGGAVGLVLVARRRREENHD